MENESYPEDPDLFVRPDNTPMVFMMSALGPERQMVLARIKAIAVKKKQGCGS
jgi:hypothetical protein